MKTYERLYNFATAVETVISHTLPLILAVVVLTLVGALLFKMQMNSIIHRSTWTVNVVSPDGRSSLQYTAYDNKPKIDSDNLIFKNEDGKIITIPYKNRTIIVTEIECEENKNDQTTTQQTLLD